MIFYIKGYYVLDTYSKSVWQCQKFNNYFFKQMFVFFFKNNIKFDLFLCSYIFLKFLNNYSYNYNLQKIYKIFCKLFLNLNLNFNMKGFLLFLFLNFNILFISFFELNKVKVAGRFLNVPNPILFNRSYRIITKNFTNILRKKKEHNIFLKIYSELKNFDNELSSILSNEKMLINDIINNRMNQNFRWRYISIKNVKYIP